MSATETKPTTRSIVFLTFPQSIAGQPIVSNLAKDYGLSFNIQEARVTPRKEGFMILEIFGEAAAFEHGMAYLRERGVKITPAAQKINREQGACTHCGLCTALCLTGALELDTTTREICFHQDKCSACGLCARICPVRAMRMDTDYGALEGEDL